MQVIIFHCTEKFDAYMEVDLSAVFQILIISLYTFGFFPKLCLTCFLQPLWSPVFLLVMLLP